MGFPKNILKCVFVFVCSTLIGLKLLSIYKNLGQFRAECAAPSGVVHSDFCMFIYLLFMLQ